MPTNSELITTVIPTFRRPALLKRAIASALDQTRPVGKVAVYDDASGDETESVVRAIMARDSRVSFHRHERNLGLVANFRYALEHVDTPYFSIMSNDDMVLPRLNEAGLDAFDLHPDAAFVSTQVIHVDDKLRVIRLLYPWHPGVYTPPDGLLRLIEWGAPAWTGSIFRTSVLEEFGNLDPETNTLMDYDFQIRIAAHKPFVVVPVPGAVFFHRSESISGEARFGDTWPAWQHMTDKLRKDESVPPRVREEAVEMLTGQLIGRMHGIGVVSSRRGNFVDARQAADLLETGFGQASGARRIRLLASIYQRLPLLAGMHNRVSGWRQPYERDGWLRRRVTLARHLSDRRSTPELEAVATPL